MRCRGWRDGYSSDGLSCKIRDLRAVAWWVEETFVPLHTREVTGSIPVTPISRRAEGAPGNVHAAEGGLDQGRTTRCSRAPEALAEMSTPPKAAWTKDKDLGARPQPGE